MWIVYVDVSKAFDKVDMVILCHKLSEMGIGGPLAVSIHNYLSGRNQLFISNGAKSSMYDVLSGVP